MRSKLLISIGAILLALGAIALSGVDASATLIIVPAIPFYLVSSWLDESPKSGMFWDSAHSPPFLNGLGIACVYFLPGIAFILLGAFSKPRIASAGG